MSENNIDWETVEILSDLRSGYSVFDEEEAKCYHALSKAIESLKQESILDKIKDDIKEMTPTYHNPDWSITDLVSISEVLKLVDKYKAESEVKE